MQAPDVVNLRWMFDGTPESAHPSYVVEDSADVIVLFEPSGSRYWYSGRLKGGPRGRNIVGGIETGYEPRTWTGHGVVRVYRPGDRWSTWRWLDVHGTWSDSFYINLEEPWVRTDRGFDSEDWILDVVADIRGDWQYKDEDELEWAAASGRFSAQQIERIRRAGTDAAAAVEARAWPFDADWSRWLPPEGLAVPTLQPGWDTPR